MRHLQLVTILSATLLVLPSWLIGNRSLKAQQNTQPGIAESNVQRTVKTTITSISGDSIFVDVGREDGVQDGTKIEFTLKNSQTYQLEVDSVTRGNARCRAPDSDCPLTVGAMGIIKVPRAADEDSGEPVNDSHPLSPESLIDKPSQPPIKWTHPPEQWNSNQPLLAPSASLQPHERESNLRGRLFTQYLHTWNWQFVDNQYSLGRIGTDFWIENPFYYGGEIRFRGDFDVRGTDIFDGQNTVDTIGRLDFLSYYAGGRPSQPWRFELGRFLPYDFPEFGFLDGGEFSYQTNDRSRFGFSVGALPEPFRSLQTGDDLQLAAFYRFRSDPDEKFLFWIGFQKTWHKRISDRDLIVAKFDYHPNEKFNAFATIWTDYYGSADRLKPNGFEITEAIYNQHLFLTPQLGVGTYYTQIRWPQLLRREIDPIFAIQIIRNRRRNYGGHLWHDINPRLRVNGRVDFWENEDAFGGTTWETELVVRQLLAMPVDLSLAYLNTDGIYSSGPGGRISLVHYVPRGLATLSYTVGDYRLTEDSDSLIHQGIMTSVDFYNASGHSISFYGDYRFGETQDAASLGVIWRKRFR